MKFFVFDFLLLIFIENSSSNPNPKIINGTLAKLGQFPHMVQLAITKENSTTTKFCGGSLINPQWVLTAAHCVKYKSSVRAYLGTIFMRKIGRKSKVIETVIHPQYKTDTSHDIALLKLEKPLEFNDLIRPINLPKNENDSPDLHRILTVPGFGDTRNSSQSNLHLRFVDMNVITNEDCSNEWYWKIKDNLMCGVGHRGSFESTCSGDSGNGLIQEQENERKIYGIVSYGAPGCLGKPKVFTRVSSYLNFIHSKIDND